MVTMRDLRMNERAWAIADACAASAAELQVAVHQLPGGARVIDAGVAVPGSLAAGRILAELCMGGLGRIQFVSLPIDAREWPGVHVSTEHPAAACMGSQYAGWAIDRDGFFAMGSGPLRAAARVEHELFARIDYAEDASRGVLMLEGRALPTDAVAAWVAGRANVAGAGITLAVAPTASVAGSVQVAARVLETGLHKMDVVGFDVRRVLNAAGTAPIAPPAATDIEAIGRTNDAILYGGQARYTIDGSDEELAALAERLPACTSSDYGTPFSVIFRRYNHDFYKIDPNLFSPAEVWLTSASNGRTFHAGRLAPDVLRTSLFGD
jgi:methenyltetrahydromethanopterin cyclohydrolase